MALGAQSIHAPCVFYIYVHLIMPVEKADGKQVDAFQLTFVSIALPSQKCLPYHL